MKSTTRSAVLLGLLLASFAPALADTEPHDKRVIHRFDYKGVTLEQSRWKDQLDLVRTEYMSIPVDDLLIGFRKRAGLDAPGNELGGWYSNDNFNIFGQVLSGLSRIYAATGDEECKARVDELVRGWAACVEPDGYFYYSDKPNAPHYVYEKMVGGLVDVYRYCDNAQAREMLDVITDWAIRNLDREKLYSMSNARLGNAEWYTLSENLYQAWLITGDLKYRDFAELWEYTEFWNHFAFDKDIFSRHPDYHAYSHVNSLSGAAAAYTVKGDQWYLNALVNAHTDLTGEQTFATGGYGPRERLKRRPDLADSLDKLDYHFETTCGSWAVFKLGKYLLEFTGDAKYGDWIELMMYNGVGASIPLGPDGGVQYTSDYSVHGARKTLRHPWSCCAGTRPMAVADYHDLIWFRGPDANLYLNLYTPSTLQTDVNDASVKLFCRKAATQLQNIVTVSTDRPASFTLNLRLPGWVEGPVEMAINGTPIPARSNEKNWIELNRQWSDGDQLSLTFPAELRVSPIDPPRPMPAALVYGPVVLACEADGMAAARKCDPATLPSELQCVDEQNLVFCHSKDKSVRFRPYYGYRIDEPYLMYIDTNAGVRLAPVFTGNWGHGPGWRFTNQAGAQVSCGFEGPGIRFIAQLFDDAGQAEVFIDGVSHGLVDLYGPRRQVPFHQDFLGLGQGSHTIMLRVTGQNHPDSKNAHVNVSSFQTIPEKKN